VSKSIPRLPRNYDGTRLTTRRVSDILPAVLSKIGDSFQLRPDLVLAAWPELVGPKVASMAQAISFVDGVLTVKVKNSTLYSLLSRNDKPRLLNELRQKFPKIYIKTIFFRIG